MSRVFEVDPTRPEDAAEAIMVDYVDLPSVTTIANAEADGAPDIREGKGNLLQLPPSSPNYHPTASGACIAIARDRRDERTEMQGPSRRRSETAAVAGRTWIRTGVHRTAMGSGKAPTFGVAAGAYSQLRFIASNTAVGYSGRPRLPL